MSNHTPFSRSTSRRRTGLALALAFALAASACGGSDDGATEDGFEFSETTQAQSDRSSESEDSFDLESDFADTDTAMESDAMEDDAMEEQEVSVERAPEADQAEGGFFESESTDAEAELIEPDRTEGNTFEDAGVRSFIDTARDPLSTFALDVDTASYSVGRQWLSENVLPPTASVRVEEYINSFDYDYPTPRDGLTILADAGPSPFNEDNVIVRLGVQAEEVSERARPDASLTFVIDTSGSMDQDNRIDLVKTSLIELVEGLRDSDEVAIVTYGQDGRVVLEPTRVRNADRIIDAIEGLRTGGSTNLEAGLRLGYDLADETFDDDRINRVILTSDGVANAGLTDPDGLVRLIRDDADRGVQLISVGVGMGNFNDALLETLADDGDGFYRYINTYEEAEALFSEDLVSSLLTVAIDGKIQVEFDERTVASYRLLGFENRAVRDDDFRNDAVDAGELGAGHQVTALYELELVDGVDNNDRLGTAQIRWEDPETGDVIESRLEIAGSILEPSWTNTAEDFRLAVTVGAFAEKLRESQYAEDVSLDQIASEADALSRGNDDIQELVELIRAADRLS